MAAAPANLIPAARRDFVVWVVAAGTVKKAFSFGVADGETATDCEIGCGKRHRNLTEIGRLEMRKKNGPAAAS